MMFDAADTHEDTLLAGAMELASRIASETASALDVDDAQHEVVDEPTFGTFHVGSSEVAFPAWSVREVVPFPERTTDVPLSPDYVLGLFNLRGDLFPIVDMAPLLGLCSSTPSADRRVAVIDCGDHYVGAVFDRTGEVLRVEDDVRRSMQHTGDAEQRSRIEHDLGDGSIIEEVLLLGGGDRLVQVLSSSLLGAVDDVPATEKRLVDDLPFEAQARSKAIVCRLGGAEYAFPMEDVLEIQPSLAVEPAPAYFENCLGVVKLRGAVRPVLDLHVMLGLSSEHDASGSEARLESRTLFLVRDDVSVAVPVDALIDTVEYAEEQLLPLPRVPGSDFGGLCGHVLSAGDARDVYFLRSEDVYEAARVSELARLSGMACAVEDRSEEDAEDDLDFFTFYVGANRLCLPLSDVQEIREFPSELLGAVEVDEVVAGLLNLRGEIVPLLNLDRRLGCTSDVAIEDRVVIVIDDGETSRGLVADRVESILHVRPSKLTDVTRVMRSADIGEGLLACVRSALMMDGTDSTLMVLDLDRVTDGGEAGAARALGAAPAPEDCEEWD